MSLLKTENSTGAAFENDDDTGAPASAPASAGSASASSAPAGAALSTVGSRAVGAVGMSSPLDSLKNAMVVDFNTLEQVIPNQGNFVCRESKKILGDEITFEVMSWQDSYVVAPEDDKAPKEVVRYSSDGVMCSDGTPVAEHLHFLKTNGYPKARLKQRVVVVAALLTTSKKADMEGALVQFDLSPASRTQWLRYQANSAFAVKMGKFAPEQVLHVKANAELATQGSNTYTMAKFSTAA